MSAIMVIVADFRKTILTVEEVASDSVAPEKSDTKVMYPLERRSLRLLVMYRRQNWWYLARCWSVKY